jgi:hypothetical protein
MPIDWRANPDEETTDWRARRGKTAHRVRREGTVKAVSYPYPSTHSCHSDMDLSFPKPDSRDVLQTTPCSHSIQISEWQHTNGMRTVIHSTPRITGANVVSVPVHLVVRLSSVAPLACLERHDCNADARTPGLKCEPCRIRPGGHSLFLYVFVSLSLVDARIKSAVRITCRTTAGHSSIPLKPPAKPR